MGFHMHSLMDRYRELNHVCRTNASRFSNLIQARVDACQISSTIYTRFIKAQRIYSFVKGQIELGNLNPTAPKRSRCPACHNNISGIHYLAADGNMSFKGKGRPSHIQPFHGELYVSRDLTAKEIKADKLLAKDCQKCSKYRADGTNTDTIGTDEDSKLHHRGIFGTTCKHRIPGDFIFMTHGGEAYIYFFKLIMKKLESCPNIKSIKAKYDIACNFARYLVVRSELTVMLCSNTTIEEKL